MPTVGDTSGAGTRGARRELLWSIGAVLALLALSLAALAAINPNLRRAIAGTTYYDLTVVHTNDTWGYLEPCG